MRARSDAIAGGGEFLFREYHGGAAQLRGRGRSTPARLIAPQLTPLRRALAPTFRSDISGWPDAALYPLASAAPRADRHTVGQQTDPLAPAAGRRRQFLFRDNAGARARTLLTSAAAGAASYGVIDNGPVDTAWRGRVSWTCARSRFRAGTLVVFIRWRGAAGRRAGFSFLLNSPAALAAGRATGSAPTAGRSCGKLIEVRCGLLFIHLQRRRAPRRTQLVSRATGSGRLLVDTAAAPPWLCRCGEEAAGAGERSGAGVTYGVAVRSGRVAHGRHGPRRPRATRANG